ncbi:MAG: (1-_4)-alpha-D-glucan 1-alpha-D-glucosylmutase [Alphaproteobacteria bacterium]|nr:(1->4)-alpha-D-glucan 1-alpha-D-glucosylmutase [Alphaproteobacteria bacterium]
MPPVVPIATYRLQLTPDFGFDQAAATVPYLKALGITHLYASPFLKARAGSRHGYDIIDHNGFNPELGGEAGFLRLSQALTKADIGLILDFVPNHMGVHHADNAWWLDMLEWGPKSPHADSFDIEWETLPERPRGGVLLPILGRPYGEALESGEIELRYDPREGSFSAWYFDHRMPIGPSRYGEILSKVVAQAGAADQPAGRRLLELAARTKGPRNPPRDQAPQFKQELAAIAGGSEIIERGLVAFQPKEGVPGAVTALHRLLERQYYRPAFWRLASNEINYRRFFDINELAGMRVEDPSTFVSMHRLVSRLIAADQLQGLRIDHIDGLRDPQQYLRRLQTLVRHARPPGRAGFYLLVEKILAEGEQLPRFAGIAGTTGYEWLNVISHFLLDWRGLDTLDRAWREASGDIRDFEQVLAGAKRRVLGNILASEFTVLTRLLARIAAGHYTTRDYSPERLRAALEAYVIHFPVYRTYITPSGASPNDQAVIEATIAGARAEWFGTDADIFDFLQDALTLDLIAPGRRGHSIRRVRRFAFKVQQFTGPMMAKSMEDTAFYRYHRLLALNEVGGDLSVGALTPEDFHRRMLSRSQSQPYGLTASATHDTKRGEDARARILGLSELADEWSKVTRQWHELNAAVTQDLVENPSPAHEYMLYQALLGAWPGGIDQDFVARMQNYAVKAAREGKEQTSWLAPNESYENGLKDFLARILDRTRSAAFLDSFEAIARRAALLGALNSLTQVTLKTMMPGVPDFYQGTEFWDLALVDPDNRRPVDFAARRAALAETDENPDWAALAEEWQSGRIKLALTRRLLAIRNRFEHVFTRGSYQPLRVEGPQADEIVAFARSGGRDTVVTVVGRLFGRATEYGRFWPSPEAWKQTSITFDGFSAIRPLLGPAQPAEASQLSVSQLFGHLPVMILHAEFAKVRKPRALAPATENS